MNKTIKFFDKIINSIVIIFFIICLGIGGYAVYDAYYVYNDANIPSNIKKLKPDENNKFSLSSLQEINEDICGWIRLDDTNINYAITIGKDNSEYLNLNYNKEFSVAGSIFLDYRSDRNFEDDYSVIYGHNMKSNQMFADIKKYGDKDFFNNHQTGKLYTENAIYDLKVIAYKKVSAFSDITYNLRIYKNDKNNDILNFSIKDAINKIESEYSKDKIIALSTCDVSSSNTRSVLFVSLQQVQ